MEFGELECTIGSVYWRFQLSIVTKINIQEVHNHITRCAPISFPDLQTFQAKLKFKTRKKKTLSLQQGKICKFDAYISSILDTFSVMVLNQRNSSGLPL